MTNSTIWQGWTTSSTSTTNSVIWNAWVTTADGLMVCSSSGGDAWAPTNAQPRTVDLAAQERAARRWKQAELRDRIKRRMQRARQRRVAEAMLRDVLSAEQWRDWQRFRSVRLRGKRGLFEINPASLGELYLLAPDGKKVAEKFCVHASSAFCVEDRVVALVLALQSDEDEVMRRANRPKVTVEEERRVVARRHRHVDRELAYVSMN